MGRLWAQPGAGSGPLCKDTRGESYNALEESCRGLSVRRDAFLSELLGHSHQVGGVWVAKTVGTHSEDKCLHETRWDRHAHTHTLSVGIHPQLKRPYVPARPAPYWGLVVNVIPGDDILQARGHGGTDGEDKALFKCLAQQAQHAVPLGAVGEVGHAVRSRIADTRIGVFGLRRTIDLSILEQSASPCCLYKHVLQPQACHPFTLLGGVCTPASRIFLVQGSTSDSGLWKQAAVVSWGNDDLEIKHVCAQWSRLCESRYRSVAAANGPICVTRRQ